MIQSIITAIRGVVAAMSLRPVDDSPELRQAKAELYKATDGRHNT